MKTCDSFLFPTCPPSPTDNPEFARCPQQLPMSSPSLPVSSCELNKNTRRCHQQPLATHLSCRLYQTCDHAVLISGWTFYLFLLYKSSTHDDYFLCLQNFSSAPVSLVAVKFLFAALIHPNIKDDVQRHLCVCTSAYTHRPLY